MNALGGFATFLVFVFLAFVGFVIYFIFKQVQFVIQAVNLYKDMVLRLDKIIELLSSSPLATMSTSSADVASSRGPSAPASTNVGKANRERQTDDASQYLAQLSDADRKRLEMLSQQSVDQRKQGCTACSGGDKTCKLCMIRERGVAEYQAAIELTRLVQ